MTSPDEFGDAETRHGSATVSTGEGNDLLLMPAGGNVAGNLGITTGNGNEIITVAGSVAGNLNLTVGDATKFLEKNAKS